jgi:hypothetical protein
LAFERVAPAVNADGTSKSGRSRRQKHTCSMSNAWTVAITLAKPVDIDGNNERFEPQVDHK